MSCLQAQEVAQQFRLLLELGAEVEGSPAAERLQQLYGIYWAVSPGPAHAAAAAAELASHLAA